MELTGCGTALVTPFRRDGSLDEQALQALVERQIAGEIDFLVPCGTTGEAATLTDDEWLRVVSLVVETAAGRVPVFGGCTHNATAEAVARARRLAQVPGLTGILTANPYYNRPSQEGQYQHFRAIAEAVPLPCCSTTSPAAPAPIWNLRRSFGWLKSTTSSASRSPAATSPRSPRSLPLPPQTSKSSPATTASPLPILALGGAGLISVASNVIPAEMAEMVHSTLHGHWDNARSLNQRFYPLMQAHFWEASPAPVKAVLALLGHGEDVLRLPMVPVTPATRQKLEALTAKLGLLTTVTHTA